VQWKETSLPRWRATDIRWNRYVVYYYYYYYYRRYSVLGSSDAAFRCPYCGDLLPLLTAGRHRSRDSPRQHQSLNQIFHRSRRRRRRSFACSNPAVAAAAGEFEIHEINTSGPTASRTQARPRPRTIHAKQDPNGRMPVIATSSWRVRKSAGAEGDFGHFRSPE